ncbi:recombinase family protein [Cryobacterium adonitolivorans]|uniref:recombinase family protein n=1 Tax=Cryobacterium adonitolivorans TaxID=1259189 RepID=UPI0018E0739B|nr:recombinase family protein [Cryobacterium adonitolivorans]
MKPPIAAAAYARISSDPTGQGLGVQRQLEDCRKLAESRGWSIAEEYVDNDVSAFGPKSRPAYVRMLDDLARGLRDGVVVYNLDRLHRQPRELEDFNAICKRAGVRHVITVTVDVDLGNDDGLFMARVIAAFAAKESGRKSARIKRQALQRAEQGRPSPSFRRPFGYTQDQMFVVESEAAVIKDLVARYIAGESISSLTAWLSREEVPTVSGAAWSPTSVRSVIRSPRIAGLRTHNSVVIAKALWPAIISEAEHDQVIAMSKTKQMQNRRAPRRYLLSGLLRCGRCGSRMASSSKHGKRWYICPQSQGLASCGRLSLAAESAELWIAEGVLARLDSPAMTATLAGGSANNYVQPALAKELEADREQLVDLGRMFGNREIGAEVWKAAREPIESRVRVAERRLAASSRNDALGGLPLGSPELRNKWTQLNLTRQAAIIGAVIDHLVVAPGIPWARAFDPDRLSPVWRL